MHMRLPSRLRHPDSSVLDRAAFYQSQIGVRHSHLALAATPVKVVYEEGNPHHGLRRKSSQGGVRLSLSVVLGQVSLKEVLYAGGCDDAAGATSVPTHEGDLLLFARDGGELSMHESDLSVAYREEEDLEQESGTKCSVEFELRQCRVDLDPGIYDRTYLLFNYSELCPEDTPRRRRGRNEEHHQVATSPRVDLNFTCADLDLGLWVPRADIRHPKDVPKFVEAFWSRNVHPEEFRFRPGGVDLRIG